MSFLQFGPGHFFEWTIGSELLSKTKHYYPSPQWRRYGTILPNFISPCHFLHFRIPLSTELSWQSQSSVEKIEWALRKYSSVDFFFYFYFFFLNRQLEKFTFSIGRIKLPSIEYIWNEEEKKIRWTDHFYSKFHCNFRAQVTPSPLYPYILRVR